ncbi:MAG: hypothetical protein ACXWWX_07215 [Actinomycetota bacterium]
MIECSSSAPGRSGSAPPSSPAIGSFCYGGGGREPEFTTAARLTGRWQDELAALTTHPYDLDEVATAFATASDNATGAIKVTLTVTT